MEDLMKAKSKPFIKDSADKGAGPSIADNITALEEMTAAYNDSSRNWKKKSETLAQVFKGLDFGKIEKDFKDRMDKLSENVEQSGKMIKSFNDKMDELKSDPEKQKKLTALMEKYHDALQSLNTMTTVTGKAVTKEDVEQRRIHARNTRAIGKQLEEFGVKVERIGSVTSKGVMDASEGFQKALKSSTAVINETTRAQKQKAENIEAVGDMQKDIKVAVGKAAVSFVKELANIIPSRLQNLQTEYNFGDAANRGLSSAEYAEFRQTNRSAQLLRGPDGASNDGAIRKNLRNVGMTGADAAAQQSRLYGIGMATGVGTSDKNITGLSDAINKFAMLENVSIADATATSKEMLTSPAMLEKYLGKTQDEILAIQREQLVVASKTSKMTGMGAMASLEIAKAQREQKFKGVIDRYKSGIMGKIYLNEYNKTAPEEHRLSEDDKKFYNSAKTSGRTLTGEESARMVELDKKMGLGENARYDKAANQLGEGKLPSWMLVGEATRPDVYNPKAMADKSIDADAKMRTEGLAASQMDLNKDYKAVTDSMNALEEATMGAAEKLSGLAKSPIGTAVGGVGSTLLDFAIGGLGAGAGLAAAGRAAGAIGGVTSTVASSGVAGKVVNGTLLANARASTLPGMGRLASMGGMARIGVGAGGGAVGYLGNMAGDSLKENGMSKTGAGVNIAADALSGAMMGAMLGPLGALAGGAIGGIYGTVTNWDDLTGDSSNATSGKQYDEFGNEVSMKTSEDILKSIDENTAKLAGTMDTQVKQTAEQHNETVARQDFNMRSSVIDKSLSASSQAMITAGQNAGNNAFNAAGSRYAATG